MSNEESKFDAESQPVGQRKRYKTSFREKSMSGKELESWVRHKQSQVKSPMKLSTVKNIISCLTLLAIFIWALILLILLPHNRPITPKIENGFHKIASQWIDPSSPQPTYIVWPEDLSGNLQPVPVHSHNDYLRRVPLFDALSVGCQGLEADVWLKDNDLFVGHTEKSLNANRTLQSLYLNPLFRIFEQQRKDLPAGARPHGVYSTNPNDTLVLLVDIKSDGFSTLPIIMEQLEPLRNEGYLTTYDGINLIPGVLTIVSTGNTPLSAILEPSVASNSSAMNRDIFFDAPLNAIPSQYNASNSFYASAPLPSSVGKVWFGALSRSQLHIVNEQTKIAAELGLRARYWDTTSWPVAWRNRIWRDLMRGGIGREVTGRKWRGVLNADDIFEASRWG